MRGGQRPRRSACWRATATWNAGDMHWYACRTAAADAVATPVITVLAHSAAVHLLDKAHFEDCARNMSTRNQRLDVPGDAAQGGAGGEHNQREQECLLRPNAIANPAGGRDPDCRTQQIVVTTHSNLPSPTLKFCPRVGNATLTMVVSMMSVNNARWSGTPVSRKSEHAFR